MDHVIAENIELKNEEVNALTVDSQEKYLGSNDLISNLEALRVQATFGWKNLNYSITKGRRKKAKKTTILDHVSGFVRPGEMIAILGASGAGKTTLLNLLADRVTEGNIEGEISLNGSPRNKYFGSISAYVEQDDVMMPTLTVEETLRFAALLRLPKEMTAAQKFERVNQTIAALGLSKVRKNMIGDIKKRGVSGGERKRTSIAIELLTNPSLLFLDEPTSGLDAFNAYNLVALMGRLAKAGRTIITTIHQPRANLFDLFDKVMFLAGGKVIYFGASKDIISYFSVMGYPCPNYTNPGDFVIDIITSDPRSTELLMQSEERINMFVKVYDEKHSQLTVQNVNETNDTSRRRESEGAIIHIRKYQANFFTEVRYICYRNWLNFLREREVTMVQLVQCIAISLIVGGIFFGVGFSQAGIQNRLGALFFLLLNQVFSNVMPRLNTFEREFATFKRERAANTYRALPYMISRVIVDMIYIFVLPALELIIVYYMIGFQPVARVFFTLLLILWVIAFCARCFGLAVAAIAGNVIVAHVISILFLLIFMLFGGLYSNTSSYWPGVGWLQWLSFVNYGYKAMLQNEFTGLVFTCSGGFCAFQNGAQVIALYNAGYPAIWLNILIIFCMGLIYCFIGYLALKIRTRKAKKPTICKRIRGIKSQDGPQETMTGRNSLAV